MTNNPRSKGDDFRLLSWEPSASPEPRQPYDGIIDGERRQASWLLGNTTGYTARGIDSSPSKQGPHDHAGDVLSAHSCRMYVAGAKGWVTLKQSA